MNNIKIMVYEFTNLAEDEETTDEGEKKGKEEETSEVE